LQVVILAGGLGTRLAPLTLTGPKPMVPVAGKPYLEHQIELLKRQGVKDIVLLTGYLGEQVEDYFGDGAKWGVSIRYSREHQPLGTGGALRLALHLLEDSFLLLYGDSYLPIRYKEPWRHLHAMGAGGVVVVYGNTADTTVRNNIRLDDQGYVQIYEKDSPRDLPFVEAGVLAFRRNVAESIPANRPVSLEKEIFPSLIATHQFAAFITDRRFYDIGTPERLQVIEEYLSNDHYANAVAH
jgi:NDP-sugar pyrophosphorylase family protein